MRTNDFFQTPISERHPGGNPFLKQVFENVVITHVFGYFLENKLILGIVVFSAAPKFLFIFQKMT